MSRFLATCFAVVCVIGIVLFALSEAKDASVRRYNKAHNIHAPQRTAHGSPPPLRQALDRGLENLRLQAKAVFYDPRVAEQQAKRRREPAGGTALVPLVSRPLVARLGPKRILAAPGDTDLPVIPKWDSLADWKRYHTTLGATKTDTTIVAWYNTFEVRSSKPIKAFIGKLALRNRAGKALHVQEYHFPDADIDDKNPYVYMPGKTFHFITQLRRSQDFANFREILHTPESGLTLEWTPYFVCYVDGTMEGDAHAWRHIDGEGLPVHYRANGLPWIVHQQYPQEIPNVTGHTIYGE